MNYFDDMRYSLFTLASNIIDINMMVQVSGISFNIGSFIFMSNVTVLVSSIT